MAALRWLFGRGFMVGFQLVFRLKRSVLGCFNGVSLGKNSGLHGEEALFFIVIVLDRKSVV